MTANNNRKAQESRNYVYEKVTKQILQSMMTEQTVPWRKTWSRKEGKPLYYNPVTKTRYKLLNRLLLGEPGEYITMNQAKDHGGHVKKGAKGRLVTYWCQFIPAKDKKLKEELEAEGKDFSHLYQYTLKYYYVFNTNDIEGLKLKKPQEPEEMKAAETPVDIADMVVSDYKVNERVALDEKSGNEPAYIASEDLVTMPEKEEFEYEEDYYAALFEQLVHSTANETRCDRRKELEKMLGGEMSVKEELIAEIGSSMILSATGIDRKETVDQQKAEVRRWVEAMENDYMLIVKAATKAESAAEMILGRFAV